MVPKEDLRVEITAVERRERPGFPRTASDGHGPGLEQHHERVAEEDQVQEGQQDDCRVKVAENFVIACRDDNAKTKLIYLCTHTHTRAYTHA